MKNWGIYGVLVILLWSGNAVYGQAQNDYELWSGVTVAGRVKKKLRFSGKYQARFENNATQLRNQYLQASVRYKFAKFYLLGVNYRITNFHEAFVVNRFDIDNSFRLPFEKSYLEARFKYQMSFPTDNDANVQRYRIRFKYQYKFNKKLRLYAKMQFFYTNIAGEGYSAWDAQRYSAGGRVKLFKKNYLDVFVQYDRETNVAAPVNAFVTGIQYLVSF